MKTATKATINRLKKMDTPIAELLLRCVDMAQNRLDWERNGYDCGGMNEHATDTMYTDYGLFILARRYDAKLISGLKQRHPSLVSTTILFGTIADCTILDINKLSRLMMS